MDYGMKILGYAFYGAVGLAVTGMAALGVLGVKSMHDSAEKSRTVGVLLTKEQKDLLSRGQLCQADLQEAFTRAQVQEKGDRIVTLSQTRTIDNCPKN